MSLTDLRSLQDFNVKLELSLGGIAEVASIGGYKKQYQVIIDPIKLSDFKLNLMSVIKTIQDSNNNVSERVLEHGEREISVQRIGFLIQKMVKKIW